jgi:mRNA interferase MazF
MQPNNPKDYTQWHKIKSEINNESKVAPIYFYEKEVWWTSIGQNVRFEEDGKGEEFLRPVLILRKFNQFFYLGVPLSTTDKRHKYYYPFTYKDDITSVALLSQLRAFDAKRLIRKDGTIHDKDYKAIQNKLTQIINEIARK